MSSENTPDEQVINSDTSAFAHESPLDKLKAHLKKPRDISNLEYIPVAQIRMVSQSDVPDTVPYMLLLGTIPSLNKQELQLVACMYSESHRNVKDGGLPRVAYFALDGPSIADRVTLTATTVFRFAKLESDLIPANKYPQQLTAILKYIFMAKGVTFPGSYEFRSGFTRLLTTTCRAYKEAAAKQVLPHKSAAAMSDDSDLELDKLFQSPESSPECSPSREISGDEIIGETPSGISFTPSVANTNTEGQVAFSDRKSSVPPARSSSRLSGRIEALSTEISNGKSNQYIELLTEKSRLSSALKDIQDKRAQLPGLHSEALNSLLAKHQTQTEELRVSQEQAMTKILAKHLAQNDALEEQLTQLLQSQDLVEHNIAEAQEKMSKEDLLKLFEKAYEGRPSKRQKCDHED
jgi:hypothetical protein